MINDFIDISYLEAGNKRQREAFKVLKRINIFDVLRDYSPILVGTIPIDIDIKGSDLDIICESHDLCKLESIARENFSSFEGFTVNRVSKEIMTVNFFADGFEIEIYAQGTKTTSQNGYRHMIIEDRILRLGGESLRQRIIELKNGGLKTEPSFARVLNLEGNPYEELLKLESLSDNQILELLTLG